MNQNMLTEMIEMNTAMQKLECGGFIVGKSLMTLRKVRDFVTSESKGTKKFIAVKDDEMIKVIRIPDNSDLDIYYKNIKCVIRNNGTERSKTDSLDLILDNYLSKDWQTAKRSCPLISEDMKQNGYIPMSYIQTYASNLAAFKNDRSGLVKEVLANELLHHSRLTLMSSAQMKLKYNTKVFIYKID